MIDFIGSIFSFAFGLIKLGFDLALGALQFIFGILGGIFSFFLSLGGFLLVGALILVAVFRRRAYKKAAQAPEGEKVYDADSEEFTSFYDQFRTEK